MPDHRQGRIGHTDRAFLRLAEISQSMVQRNASGSVAFLVSVQVMPSIIKSWSPYRIAFSPAAVSLITIWLAWADFRRGGQRG